MSSASSGYTRMTRSLAILLLVAGGIGIGLWISSTGPSDEEIRETIITSLQREADTTVVVTGYMDVSTRVTVEDTRRYPVAGDLPWYTVPFYRAAGSPQVSLGTNRTAVQVPGRVSYGFAVDRLTADDIEIIDGSNVRIRIPPVEVFSAEPYLNRLDLQTSIGWARWSSSGSSLERRALGDVRTAMRRQGRQHLRQSDQPTIHTARALEKLLRPIVRSAGIDEPTFEFVDRAMTVTLSDSLG